MWVVNPRPGRRRGVGSFGAQLLLLINKKLKDEFSGGQLDNFGQRSFCAQTVVFASRAFRLQQIDMYRTQLWRSSKLPHGKNYVSCYEHKFA